MATKSRRVKYLIHPSSQLKYIALSMLATLVMSLFCTYFILENGESVLKAAKKKPLVPFYSIRQSIVSLEKDSCSNETSAKVAKLKNDVSSLKNTLEVSYIDTLYQWNQTKRLVFAVLFVFLLCAGSLSLIYSHRVVGPVYRIQKCIDMLCEGKDIPPVVFRKNDEFKSLADSLDTLRIHLKDKGWLESEDQLSKDSFTKQTQKESPSSPGE